jgi:hypothetical protein
MTTTTAPPKACDLFSFSCMCERNGSGVAAQAHTSPEARAPPPISQEWSVEDWRWCGWMERWCKSKTPRNCWNLDRGRSPRHQGSATTVGHHACAEIPRHSIRGQRLATIDPMAL